MQISLTLPVFTVHAEGDVIGMLTQIRSAKSLNDEAARQQKNLTVCLAS